MEDTIKYLKEQINNDNERSSHTTKRLNRLGAWGFFKVLYRDYFFKLFLVNIIMLIFLVPALIAIYNQALQLSTLTATLPTYNGLGLSTTVWRGVNDFYETNANSISLTHTLYIGLGLIAACVSISGCMGVIRDSFWTGKVVVFKSFWRGVKASIGYSAISVVVLYAAYFGLYMINYSLPIKWLAIVLTILGGLVAIFLAIYALITCAVATTYKLSVKDTLKTAWKLMFLNIVPNIFNLVIALLPILLYILFQGVSFLGMLILAFFFMLGFFYIVFVYMTHMMKTFMLFNPVVPKKKGE